MKKIELKSVALVDNFTSHSKIKNDLLLLMKDQPSDKLKDIDNIEKLDWSQHKDMNRPWVKLIETDLLNHFKKCAKILHYEDLQLKALWFQQYNKNGVHNWHSHGDNYTGVYYVNWNKECAKTRYVDPITQEVKDIEAEEGDVVIFPSTVIHRANTQKIDFPKVIISFNISFDNIQRDKLNQYENA